MFGYLNLAEPTQIKPNEAQEANSCDLTKGFLGFRRFTSFSDYLKKAKIYGREFKIENGTLKRSDGAPAGMIAPSGAPSLSVGNSGVLNGEYSYVYTVADDYIESKPSPPATITVTDSQVVISGFQIPDSKAKYIRIYRLSPGATEYLLVAEIPVTQTSYTDNISDDQLGSACDSWNNDSPPKNLRYVISLHDKLFVATGNKLYFSRTGIPEAFPADFFIKFDSDVTGLATVNETLLIFTENRIYALYGHDETDYVLKVSNAIVGALHNSVQDIGSRAIFTAKDGIYITNGVEAVKISEKIEPLFPINPAESSFDGRFYVVSDGNRKIVYDTVLRGFETADDSDTFVWHSKDFISKRPLWQLKQLSVVFEGELNIEVYRDGELMTKLKGDHSKRKHRLFYVKGLRGNRFSVRFIGKEGTRVYNYGLIRAE